MQTHGELTAAWNYDDGTMMTLDLDLDLESGVIGDGATPLAFVHALLVSALYPGSCPLEVQGLKKSFGNQVILDDLDSRLRQQGEVVLLRGENGSDKTTLLKTLTGHRKPKIRYRFPWYWWQDLNFFGNLSPAFVARGGVGRTWQDLRFFSAPGQAIPAKTPAAQPAV